MTQYRSRSPRVQHMFCACVAMIYLLRAVDTAASSQHPRGDPGCVPGDSRHSVCLFPPPSFYERAIILTIDALVTRVNRRLSEVRGEKTTFSARIMGHT